ncbi:MAG: ATP-dependent protease LonB [Clostridiales bacterium]|nr:ATP-dependent protease LonB [Clostridiales bacterium]
MKQQYFTQDTTGQSSETGTFRDWRSIVVSTILFAIQLLVTVVVGVYFYTQLKSQRKTQPTKRRESGREYEKLQKMRSLKLTEPLAERVRPAKFSDIIGQEDGVKSLKAILCGKNPQHVLIYGPPGIGKTCAARLVLEAAKKSESTPFLSNAPFIEMDATCVRFDERAIADPLIGSVHDPIYQGAGPLGVQGVPQPKQGAVSKAHGGVLFLDEIGELHPIQMNKLLKVLEDRKVMLESAYYNADDTSVPRYIHDIFKNGLPADFRLVGATTRSPQEISPALRSRCMEVFFRALEPAEVADIAYNAAERAGYEMSKDDAELIGRYASCGRDAVNIVQMCAGLAQMEKRKAICAEDIEWVVYSGHYPARPEQKADTENRIGVVHGLAIIGSHQGATMEIEAVAQPGTGKIVITGIVEEEEIGGESRRIKRKSTARCSLENVMTLLHSKGYETEKYDLHINFPGGTPVDGPSAGVAMAVVAASALTGRPIDGHVAVTGEVSVRGFVKPVGGVPGKVEAAERAGLTTVLIPMDNRLERFEHTTIEVVPISTLEEAIDRMILPVTTVSREKSTIQTNSSVVTVLAAEEQTAAGKA